MFILRKILIGIRQLPRTIKNNIIAIGVMFVLWMIPAIFLQFGKDPDFLRPLNFITAGKSGIVNPSVVQMAGGVVSKSMILSFLIRIIIPSFKNKNFKLFQNLKGYFSSFSAIFKNGLSAIGSFIACAGLALVMHGFMSTDFSMENSFVSIIGMIYAIVVTNKSKLIGIQGFVPGFLFSFISAYFKWNTYIIGGIIIAIGMIIVIISFFTNKPAKKIKQSAALILALMIVLTSSISPVWAEDEEYNESNTGVEIVVPDSISAFEPFDVIIKIKNPNIKKQINRIEVETFSPNSKYISKPEEDADGKNYKGEDEVKFTIAVNEYTKEARKIELSVSFLNHSRDSSGTLSSMLNLRLKKGITQLSQVVKIDLPSQYTYKQTGNDPYTSSFNYEFYEDVKYHDLQHVGFGRWFQIAMHDSEGPYYYEELKTFDITAYALENVQENSETVNEAVIEAPKELLDKFGASKGVLITYEYRDTKLKTPSTDILMDIIVLNNYYFYLKGSTIFKIHGYSVDGVMDGSAEDLVDIKKSELHNAMASIYFEAIPSETPTYPVTTDVYFFPEDSEDKAVNTENTVIASNEAVKEAVTTPFSKGAMSVALISTIFSTAIASVAAGAMTATTTSNNEDNAQDKRRREYKLIISKNVGQNIKSDQKVSIFASIYERIYEDDGTYTENINRTLSEMIEFSSPDSFIKFSQTYMSGDSKAVDFVAESNSKGERVADKCTISCVVTGDGGTHQQNVIFRIVAEPYVSIEEKLFILADSGESYEFQYEPMDFIESVDSVTVNCHQSDLPFEINVPKDLVDKKIKIKDLVKNKKFNGFYDTYTCEIIAKNNKETAKTIFSVVMCQEGITVDFLGAKNEIIAKLKDDNSGKMVETKVKVCAALWNKKKECLEVVAPDNISLSFEDEKDVFNLLGANSKENSDFHTPSGKSYLLSVSHSLPSMDSVNGVIHVEGDVEGRRMSSDIDVQLIPDILTFEKEFEKEYQNCKQIIEVYMSERFKTKKLMELEREKHKLGIEDLKLFRQNCWGIAQRCIMQEKEQYIIDEAWYDEAIATAEFLVYVGDIAFDLALSPIGGPIAGFLAANVKSSFIEVLSTIIEHPDKPYFEIICDFVSKRIEQTIGSVDGLIEVPKANETKKMIIWIASYVIYRIGFHWWFDKDEEGKPIGIKEAAKAGVLDFVGKGFGILLGEFIGKQGKGRWPEKISITDADQELVNKNVSKAAKATLDEMDKLAAKTDKAALELYNNLIVYYNSIKL